MASKARHTKHCSPHLPSHSLYSDSGVVEDLHMLKSQSSNLRKRQCSKQDIPLQNGTSLPSPKRQKPSHPPFGSHPPPALWDNLSKVWLTKGALKELDRRNAPTQRPASPPRPPYQRPSRRDTRHVEQSHQLPQSAWDILDHCTTESLKGIKQFARHGGPDLRELRGYLEPIDLYPDKMSSSQPNPRRRKRSPGSSKTTANTTTTTTATKTSKSAGAYSRNFLQNLVDHGVYPERYRHPDGRVPPLPNNWEDIQKRLVRPRPSLSPSRFSEELFEKFQQADADVSKENSTKDSLIPIIEGEVENARCVAGDVPFNNLAHLTDGSLVAGKPDKYYGARPEQLDRSIREELSHSIVPSTQSDLPLVPNFFLEAKGPDGTIAVANRQTIYHGALGARGMQSLQSYREDELVFDNDAYTIAAIYSAGSLKLFTTHPSQPASAGGYTEYYINQLNIWGMAGNLEQFRQGAIAYRNARDWAKEQRDKFITAANRKLRKRPTDSQSAESTSCEMTSDATMEQNSADSNTLVDEPTSDGDEDNLRESLLRNGLEQSLNSQVDAVCDPFALYHYSSRINQSIPLSQQSGA